MSLYAPVGGQLPMQASAGVVTLADNGPYTVEVQASGQAVAGAPLKIRVNTAAPPEPIALATSTERAVTLALGEVKRYSFDVAQGQVLALQVASTAMDVQASISGGAISDGFASVVFPGTSSHSGPRYAQQSGPAVLSLSGTSRNEARATGAVQLSLQAPTPAAAVLGTAVDTIVVPAQLMSHGYVLPADGKHLLCVAYTGATGNGGSALVKGVVWGPSATATNYAGDLGTTGPGTAFDTIGNLRAGANTLTFMSSLAAPAPLAFRLVGLAAPTMLVAGAGPVNDTLAACQRRYFRFAGLAGGSYTLRLTAPFTGSVRIRKEGAPRRLHAPNGHHQPRLDPAAAGGRRRARRRLHDPRRDAARQRQLRRRDRWRRRRRRRVLGVAHDPLIRTAPVHTPEIAWDFSTR